MASLRVTKRGKYWQYLFESAQVDGKRQRVSKSGFRTKSAAEQAGIKAMAEYNDAGVNFTPSTMSFSDLLDKWLELYCALNLKPVTIEGYVKRINNYIKPELGKYRISALNAGTLQRFINKKALENYSRNTLSTLKGILSSSLGYAVQTGLLKTSPMYSVKLPSPRNERIRSRTAPHVYIPQDKIKAIFDRFPQGTSAFLPMMFGYKCGMRIGEAFAVTWDCVDFDRKTVSIQKQVQWDKDKGMWYFTYPKYDSVRTIDIDDALVQILREEKEKQKRSKEYYGEHYTLLYKNCDNEICAKKCGEQVELVSVREDGSYITPRIMQHASRIIHYDLNFPDFTFHSFRHTHATMLAEIDMPPKYIQARMGHSDIQTTMQVYQHLSPTIAKKGADMLQNMFNIGGDDMEK